MNIFQYSDTKNILQSYLKIHEVQMPKKIFNPYFQHQIAIYFQAYCFILTHWKYYKYLCMKYKSIGRTYPSSPVKAFSFCISFLLLFLLFSAQLISYLDHPHSTNDIAKEIKPNEQEKNSSQSKDNNEQSEIQTPTIVKPEESSQKDSEETKPDTEEETKSQTKTQHHEQNIEDVIIEEPQGENEEQSRRTDQGRKILNDIRSKLIPQRSYFNISTVKIFKQLPICALAYSTLISTLKVQNYTNYHIVPLPQKKLTYDEISSKIEKECKQRELVVIVERELPSDCFQNVNTAFQRFKIWALYVNTDQYLKIVAFYRELFFKVTSNDFNNQNTPLFTDTNQIPIVLALLSLVNQFLGKIQNFFKEDSKLFETLLILPASEEVGEIKKKIVPYQKLFSLSQTYPIKVEEVSTQKKLALAGKVLRQTRENFIKVDKITRFLEDVEMKNLPLNHSLADRERIYMESTYELANYKEIPLCIAILSNNNIQNDRYKKVLYTVYNQQYSNYRILFVDDVSTDSTLQSTKQYAQYLGFNSDQIKYIRNTERRYATYNLRYAAFNYCEPTDVMVIVDGDDELVGRQAFRLISSFYQKQKQNWIVYTNYFTSDYQIGSSYTVPRQYIANNKLYRKIPRHLMGPIRTFYTGLYRLIEEKDHKFDDGTYLDTMYDDAMQEPMLEMSGNHIEYIPELCYLYNRNHGNNDNSSPEKKKHKKEVYSMILKRQTYKNINSLWSLEEKQELKKRWRNH